MPAKSFTLQELWERIFHDIVSIKDRVLKADPNLARQNLPMHGRYSLCIIRYLTYEDGIHCSDDSW